MRTSIKKIGVMVSVLLISMIGLAACGGTTSASQQPVEVQVTLTEFKIDSSMTEFKVGVPYHFVVTNEGSVEHEFEIMSPLPAGTSSDEAERKAFISIEEDELQPGDTATADYTFQDPYPAGSLEFACHLPGHYEGGMHTLIVVSQ